MILQEAIFFQLEKNNLHYLYYMLTTSVVKS